MDGKNCGWIIACIVCLVIGGVAAGLITYYFICEKSDSGSGGGEDQYTSLGVYSKAAVAADAANCSKVGRDILKKGGNAVDGAIASMLCVGVIHMHSVGVGGGGFMIVYNRTTRKARVFDFREKAPASASQDMFKNKKEDAKYGGHAIAVPGEVRGYLAAWEKHGQLPWRELVQPAIDIARNGFEIDKPVSETLEMTAKRLKERPDPGLRELLFDENGILRKEGDVITNLKYAATLEMIRDNPDGFYTDELAKNIVRDMTVKGGLITAEDLRNYSVVIRGALDNKLGGLTMYTAPAPASGPVIALILNILKGYNFSRADLDLDNYNKSALTLHRIIEAFKFGYARRSQLADPAFEPNVTKVTKHMMSKGVADYLRGKITDSKTHDVEYYADFYVNVDYGTSHLNVLDQFGNAVGITSTINFWFGSLYRSTTTGIIYNDQMFDFDNPGDKEIAGVYPSTVNYPAPGKRPFSSVTPVILTDSKGDVKLVVGASGGKKITTAVSLVVMNKLWFGRDISKAVDQPRVHSNLVPDNNVVIEKYPNEPQYTLSKEIQARLEAFGHVLVPSEFYAAVQAIDHTGSKIYAKCDPRKRGSPAGY